MLLLPLLVCLIIPRWATAQGLGSIRGTVTDPSGAVVPSATVTATQPGTGSSRSVTTNAEGDYLIPGLQPAQYSLRVSLQGFREFTRKGITLLADQVARVDVQLEVGPTAELITVEAATTQVDTTTATLKQVVGQSQIVELPLNGRNPAQLTYLVAGVNVVNSRYGRTRALQGNDKNFPGAVAISSSGSQQGNQVLYLLDGAIHMDTLSNVNQPFPFPDALQEFSIQTSNYAAQYGLSAGAVVNVVTKSGTNSLHGSLFEFNRNAVFNARNFFAANRDQLKRNQFGGALGGPVVIPGLYDGRDRTFFFVGYQGTQIRNIRGGLSATVPTQTNLNGDFSALLDATNPANPTGKVVQIVNPATGAPYPGNLIDPTTFDPAAVALMKYLPSVGGNGRTFFTMPNLVERSNDVVARLDHAFGTNDRLSGRYTYDKYTQDPTFDPSNILTYGNGLSPSSQNVLLNHTHIFRSNLLNDFYFSVARMFSSRGPASDVPNVADFGVQGTWQPEPKQITSVNAVGFFSFGASGPGDFYRTSFNFADDLRWVKGRHNIAFGGTIMRSRHGFNVASVSGGQFRFSTVGTNYALASFLLGKMDSFLQGNQQIQEQRITFSGVYAQDIFRASRRLTINYGLRYEPYVPWHEVEGRGELFSPEAFYAGTKSVVFPNAPPGLLFRGDAGVPENFTTGNYRNFMPRLGFAYDVFGDGKTSLRGGAGMFYQTLTPGFFINRMTGITPYSLRVTITNPVGPFSNPYLGTTNPFPFPRFPPSDSVFPAPVLAVFYGPNFEAPVIYNWNLAIEHQFAYGWFLRTAYVASHASHLPTTVELNPATYIPGSTLGPDQRRMFPGYASIQMTSSEVNSNYNSLQVTVDKRFSSGLTFMANYTWSKNLDNAPFGADGFAMGGEGTSTIPWNFPDRTRLDYGPYTFDRTHRFVTSYVYALPKLAGVNRWLRGGFGNWQVSGIFSAQTGNPLTIVAGADRSQTRTNTFSGWGDRGEQIGEPYGGSACTSAPCVNYLNPSSFQLPEIGTFGTMGKGSLRGPGSVNWDMGFFKSFPFTERVSLQFRAEFFNIFNRANFGNPGTNLSAAGFGTITVAEDPRIGQLALKLIF